MMILHVKFTIRDKSHLFYIIHLQIDVQVSDKSALHCAVAKNPYICPKRSLGVQSQFGNKGIWLEKKYLYSQLPLQDEDGDTPLHLTAFRYYCNNPNVTMYGFNNTFHN